MHFLSMIGSPAACSQWDANQLHCHVCPCINQSASPCSPCVLLKSLCRFLNRLLGLPLEQQSLAYEYFGRTLEATVASAKSQGLFDAGIRHLGPPLDVIDSTVLHKDRVSGEKVFTVRKKGWRGPPAK